MNILRLLIASCLFCCCSAIAQSSAYLDLVQSAQLLMGQGKLDEAVGKAEAARKLDEKRFEAPATLALILHAQGKAAQAQAAVEEALKLVPAEQKAKVEAIAKRVASNAGGTVAAEKGGVLPATARRRLDGLFLIIEEADKARTNEEKRKLFQEYLERSGEFVKEYPKELTVWTLRAVAALELGQAKPGWAAGQEMTKLGADDSEDPKVRRVMAMLDRKGWLGKEAPTGLISATKEQPFQNSLGMKFVPVAGTDVLFSIWETRRKDYESYAAANRGVDLSLHNAIHESQKVGHEANHPVANVSWNDAKAFCEWLTRKERSEGLLGASQSYRLPTDQEWSAAVGLMGENGATPKEKDEQVPGVYPWGRQWPPPNDTGNFADATTKSLFPAWKCIDGYLDGYATTSPVGSFGPLPPHSGLFDLAGNLWEWCEDWNDGELKARVLRGGSWCNNDPRSLLSSCRGDREPGNRHDAIGFRVVLVGVSAR